MHEEQEVPLKTPPSWYHPFKVRDCWDGPFSPLVGLHGLDIEADKGDRGIFDILNGRSVALEPSVFYKLNLEVPKKKFNGLEERDPSAEPKGIIQSYWAEKHRYKVPGVIVIFLKGFSVTDSKEQIEQIRNASMPHGTQLLVTLIRNPADEEITPEKASALCAATEIVPKSLFILTNSSSDRLQLSIQRLEVGIVEALKIYYAGRVRRGKTLKNRTNSKFLKVRYSLKLGFYHEMRNDLISAISSYDEAISLIKAYFPSPENSQEVKCVVSVVLYRLGRIHSQRSEIREAERKLYELTRFFSESKENCLLEFFSWKEQTYRMMGELIINHIRLHPAQIKEYDSVKYFVEASINCNSRRKLLEDMKFDANLETLIQSSTNWKPTYIGEKPLAISPDPQFMLHIESCVPHKDLVINHLGIASEFCKDHGQHRSRCFLMCMIGEEFYCTSEFKRTVMLMKHIIQEFGKEPWLDLIHLAAELGEESSRLDNDVASQLGFLVILLNPDFQMFKSHGVYSAMLQDLIRQYEGANIITSYVPIHSNEFLQCKFEFISKEAKINQDVEIGVSITNHDVNPQFVKCVELKTNLSNLSFRVNLNVEIQPRQSYTTKTVYIPKLSEANKTVQLVMGLIDIGRGNLSLFLQHPYAICAHSKYSDIATKDTLTSIPSLKVEANTPSISVDFDVEKFFIKNETGTFKCVITNSDKISLFKVSVTIFIHAPKVDESEEHADLHKASENLFHSFELKEVLGESTEIREIQLCTVRKGEYKIIGRLKFTDSFGQSASQELTTFYHVGNPLSIDLTLTDHSGHLATDISYGVPVIVTAKVISRVKFPTTIHGAEIIPNDPKKLGIIQLQQCLPITLNCKEEAKYIFEAVTLERVFEDTVNAKVKLDCTRVDKPFKFPVVINYDFNITSRYTLLAKIDFGLAKYRVPLTATYTLMNLSNNNLDLVVTNEPSDYIMASCPKKISVKLCPESTKTWTAILFPLKAGELQIPNLNIENVKDPTNPPVVAYLSPARIFVQV